MRACSEFLAPWLPPCLNERMKRRKADFVTEIVRRLESAYGPRQLVPDGDPLSTLVETILSQNTSDLNSGRAFRSLRRVFPLWEDVAAAEPERISDAIRAGGLGDIKGRRIKEALQAIKASRGDFSLDFLNKMPLEEARQWLKELPGVGDKTAACVLLFSLGRPALPVDTHIHRISRRLGLIAESITAEKAHLILQQLVSQGLVYQFHVLMIDHGRKKCRARNPACSTCVLSDICPSSGKFANGALR